MGNLARSILAGFFLLACIGHVPGALAEDIDVKIKKLEGLESRIEAKLKRLEELEARLEARLETSPQFISTRSGPLGEEATTGMTGMPRGVPSASASAGAAAAAAGSGQLGGQVAFRGGYAHMDGTMNSLFSSGGSNNGWWVGGSLDIPLMKDPFFNNKNTVLGQISLDVIGTGNNTKSSGAIGGVFDDGGAQNLLKIAISPKYRIDSMGALRPWIIPIGLSFILNSPPSSSATYLDVGGTTGFGVEYVLPVLDNHLSLGLAFAYNFYPSNRNSLNTNNINVGPYVGINF